jgi:MoaA/NifB/PqqE/SkfB family radical SAM enzyme
LSEPKFVDIIQYENDFKRLSELGKNKMELIKLMGGEPLLNPKIKDLIIIARKYFSECKIQIVTNGTLLTNQNEEFWEICDKYRIEILISYYPVKLDYNSIKMKAKKHKVHINYSGGNTKREMSKFELDRDGAGDYKKSFKKCKWANSCVNLRNGKIYPCPTAANIDIFNAYFGENFTLSEKDYIDIYKAQNIDEIFDFLCGPVPFCRFCTHNNENIEWRTSRKEKSEWMSDKDSALTAGQHESFH